MRRIALSGPYRYPRSSSVAGRGLKMFVIISCWYLPFVSCRLQRAAFTEVNSRFAECEPHSPQFSTSPPKVGGITGAASPRASGWALYDERMKRALVAAGFSAFGAMIVARAWPETEASAQPAAIEAPAYAAQLRYIGRDGATGLAARVDDRFIAAVEEDYANYGKVEAEAIPPPPAGDVDLARLVVPALGINAPIQRFGVDKFGRLDVPQDEVTAGWHPDYGDLPGAGGSTFLAAHYMYANQPGIFYELTSLAPGDAVTLTTTTGFDAAYRVVSVVDYPLASIDMGAILHGLEGVESVVLMTCSGPPNEGNYPFRTVVIAIRDSG